MDMVDCGHVMPVMFQSEQPCPASAPTRELSLSLSLSPFFSPALVLLTLGSDASAKTPLCNGLVLQHSPNQRQAVCWLCISCRAFGRSELQEKAMPAVKNESCEAAANELTEII